jgi:hypothetical protein
MYDMDHAPVIADFDHDGKLDVFVVGGDGTQDPDTLNHGRAYALAAGEGTFPDCPMFRRDLRHSACVHEAWSGVRTADSRRQVAHLSAHPDPFRRSATIWYMIPAAGRVDLRIYDVRGRLVQSLVSERKMPGTHSATWDGIDNASNELPSGIYFARLHGDGFSAVRKLLYIR